MEKLMAQLRALPSWQRYILLMGIPAVLIIYIWQMLLPSVSEQVSKLESDIQTTELEIQSLRSGTLPESLQKLRMEADSLEKELIRMQTELTSLVGNIPSKKDSALILRNLGTLAKKSGLTILNMQLSEPQSVTYVLQEEAGKRFIKELGQSQQQQAQQTQQQPNTQQGKQTNSQNQQPQTGVSFIRSELKLTLLGSYESMLIFLNRLGNEGILSYPRSLTLISDGTDLKAELTLNIIMQEEASQ